MSTQAAVLELWSLPLFPSLAATISDKARSVATLVDGETGPNKDALTAAVLFRLAIAELVANRLDSAQAALTAIGRVTDAGSPWRIAAGIAACRIAARRGEVELAAANVASAVGLLSELASGPQNLTVDKIGTDAHAWRAAAIELAFALAEVELEQPESNQDAIAMLEDLLDQGVVEQADAAFGARSLVVFYALLENKGAKAADLLRKNITLATVAGAVADQVEARIALIGLLSESDEHVALSEASKHAQQARDYALAIKADRPDLYVAALIAQANVLERSGKRSGALDRCVEIAREAQQADNLPQYISAVGLMAEMYSRSGDAASAYRTIVTAKYSLSQSLGADATEWFRPLMARLVDHFGKEKVHKVAAEVVLANEIDA